MYEQIRNHPSVVERYTKRLVEAGVVDEAQLAEMRQARRAALEAAPATARTEMPRQQVFAFGGLWRGLRGAGEGRSAGPPRPARPPRGPGAAPGRPPPPPPPPP